MDNRHATAISRISITSKLASAWLLAISVLLITSNGYAGEITPKIQNSINKGMKWLLKAQLRDGSWGLDDTGEGDITCTALAGMAILTSGVTERSGTRSKWITALRRAAKYVILKAKKSKNDISFGQTTLIQRKLGQTVHNFFGVIFLTQLYGMGGESYTIVSNTEMRYAIQRLSRFIAKMQEADGSWHKQTFGSLKATCMAWLALRASASTGVPIKHAAVHKTLKFIKEQYNPSSKLFDAGGANSGYYHSYQSLYATASSIRVMYGMGLGQEIKTRNAAKTFIDNVDKGPWKSMFLSVEGEDYLAAAMMTHSLINENGVLWNRWYPLISKRLMGRQNGDGSWITTACIRGRTFATACSLLTLMTPNRLLPIQD